MRYFPVFFLVAALISLSCNKTGDVASNHANILVINAAPTSASVNVFFNDKALTVNGAIPYDSNSAIPENVYPGNATAGVHDFYILDAANDTLIPSGFTSFQNGQYYSLFVFDTLGASKRLQTLFLQDNLNIPNDSSCFLRYVNFSPGTYYGLYMLNITPPDTLHTANDTVFLGYKKYAGVSTNPSSYTYTTNPPVKGGLFDVSVIDTAAIPNTIAHFSLNLLGGKSYTLYLQGYAGRSGADSLALKTILHN